MRNLAAALGLALASASQAQLVRGNSTEPFPEGKRFSVVIERSGLEWRARCDLGCNWTGVTGGFACKDNCDAILDANGLVTTRTERDPKAAFSFVLSADSEGRIYAKPRAGTVWQGLGWSCNTDPCTARVNEFGVSVGGAALTRWPGR